MKLLTLSLHDDRKLLNLAMLLSIITIVYNLAEGALSTFFGASDETLALFGFGADSFVEVISGTGIAHMIWRMKRSPVEKRDGFEITALRITGFAFYLLTFGLIAGSAIVILTGTKPETTLAGIIISGISIITMYFLYRTKLDVGNKLDSAPMVSDAKCTKTCFYLSFILLGSSLLYEIFGIPLVDVLGSLGIAWYAFREGREAFEKAKNGKVTCCDDHCN
ncbi:MAG: hypothetical protein KFF73_04170 [Cyclobacteriaceae bacterium]|nr:hypothetical protein [Cyclobacteriaceae bacterium]